MVIALNFQFTPNALPETPFNYRPDNNSLFHKYTPQLFQLSLVAKLSGAVVQTEAIQNQ